MIVVVKLYTLIVLFLTPRYTGSTIFMATHILSRFSRKTNEIEHLLHWIIAYIYA